MEYLSNITAVLTRKRGRIINVETTGVMARIIAAIPVAESFDLAGELRSATAGRAFWGVEFYGWAPVPDQMLQDLISKIRQRKGLPPNPPKIDDLIGP